MASVQKTIDIVFGAVDNTGSALQAISSNLSSFSGGVKDATQPLANLTDSIIKVDVALTAMSLAMAAWATNEAGKFRDSLNEIYTLLDVTPQQFEGFTADIKSFAGQSTQSLGDIAGAIYQATSAGIAYTDSLDFLTAAEQSSVAGKATLNEAVTLLASTMRAYGAGIDETQRYQDAFQQTVKDGITTFPALVSSMGQVTAIAAQLKVPIETLGAAIATMTTAGIQTPQAMTSIQAALNALLNPSTSAAKLAEELGIQFNATAVKTKGLETVLNEVAVATKGDEEKMGTLFGSVEALKGIFALTADGSKNFRDELSKFAADAGVTAAAYDKMKDNFALTNQNIINNLQLTLIAAGEPLLASYGTLARDLSAILKDIGVEFNSGGAFQPIIDAVKSLAAELDAELKTIAINLPAAFDRLDFTPLIEAFGRLGATFGSIFGGVDLTTVEGLAGAMQAVVNGSAKLIDATNGIAIAFEPMIDKIVELIKWYGTLDSDTQTTIGEVLGWGKVANLAASAIEPFALSIGGIAVALKTLGPVAAEAGAATATLAATLGAAALAIGGVYFGVTQNLDAWQKYKDITQANADATDHAADATTKIATKLEELNARLGTSFTSMDDFNKAVDSGAIVYDKIAKAWVSGTDATEKATAAQAKHADALGMTADEFDRQIKLESDFNAAVAEEAANTQTSTDSTQKAIDAKRGYSVVIDETTGKIIGYNQVGDKFVAKEEEKKKAVEESVLKLAEYKTKMEEIASNERIKLIESTVKLNIADMEEQTKRLQAAFQSVNTTIQSTGDVISSIFGALDKADTWWQKGIIEDQLEKENKLREEAAELQKELTLATIKEIEAKTNRLLAGDSLITIQADGMEPEIEAFMWKILEKIRAKASAEAADFLLGVA